MRPQPTELRIDEHGDETHESWVLIRANRVTSGPPGHRLFDSEIPHQHFIMVQVSRVTRKRDLNHDWLHATQLIMELHMSQAQWGAFVSSFGDGNGVPATLNFLASEGGYIPQAPVESRLGESVREVRESGNKALAQVTDAYAKLVEAFENGGRKAQREAIQNLGTRIQHAPANMEFAAKTLVEHTENVVTKARADIEAMALAQQARLGLEAPPRLELGSGEGGEPMEPR